MDIYYCSLGAVASIEKVNKWNFISFFIYFTTLLLYVFMHDIRFQTTRVSKLVKREVMTRFTVKPDDVK